MLDWQGDKVLEKTIRATRKAMDKLMAECVGAAKAIHPPNVRTATYQGSIRMEPTQLVRDQLIGRWGSFICNYAIYLEMGTWKMPEFRPLRQTADRLYPKLPAMIKREMAA